ncbi:MAG: NAD(P)/FAD-dependent oxidoreductase [Candidatus Dormibacteraeota bacterium]|nr:NAD(P)/FAD-dependent oxidoreductase [Candidatus Dormibacteraeota bacterium]
MGELVDAVVIGMGPGGEDLAGRLAEAGWKVAGVEERLVGGECPYFGCIPSKMIVRAADLLAESRRVPVLSGSASDTPDWGKVAHRIRAEATDNWNDQVAADRFTDKGGILVRGHGRLEGPGRVVVGERELEARRAVVLNPGTSPAVPPIPGLDTVPYWTNRELLQAETLPASLTVLGGGAIGMEMAQGMARFGARVTVVEALDRIVSFEEPEASEALTEVLKRDGMVIRTGAKAVAVSQDAQGITVELEGGETVTSEKLLVSVGRRSNLSDIGLETVGLDPKTRYLPVTDRMRVEGVDRLWAVGDVCGKGAFTHLSMYQSAIALADIEGRQWPPADYRALPRVTFTDPEIGSTGLTEQQARERGIRVRVGTSPTSSSTRGWIHGPGNDGLLKLVEDGDRGVLVGATSMGPTGGEVLSILVLAITAQIPTEQLRHLIYAYPTFHRGLESALAALS